jgi:cytoskeletal protein CcmA (bactofilin family)
MTPRSVGAVKGNIVARGKVRLGSHARVEGDIDSTALAIAKGAVFIGTVTFKRVGALARRSAMSQAP